MIHINTLNDTRFTLNGVEYLKNYISVVRGNRIEVFNCYEREDVLVRLTDCEQVSLNGSVYTEAAALQSALLEVIYSRFTMGDGSTYIQNNKGRTIGLGYLPTNDAPYSEVISKINAKPFIITETETPVLFTAFKTDNNGSKKYTFLFLGGKGTWGLGGSPIASFNLLQLAPETLTVSDIEEEDNSVIISLEEVGEDGFIAAANAHGQDFSDSETFYYFSYITGGVLYIKRFVGIPGIYGNTGTHFTNDDFVSTTNDAVQPGPAIPTQNEVTAAGNVINDNAIIFSSGAEKLKISREGLHYKKGEKQVNIRFEEPLEDAPAIVTHTVPAKNEDDAFAMASDLASLTFEEVLVNGNSATTPIILNNYTLNPTYDAIASLNINGKININSGSNNVFVGKGSGKDNTGSYNTAFGAYGLLKNTTGNSNTTFGYSALWQNINGSYNCVLGSNSLAENISGNSNIAIGYNALVKCNSDSNISIGHISLFNLSSGLRNGAIGRAAGNALTTGSRNVIYGYQAFSSNPIGNTNTVIGCSAMQNATSGDANIWIGGTTTNNTSVNITTGSYNTFIGTDLTLSTAEKTASNNVIIADGQGQRAFSANLTTGDIQLMGKKVPLIDPLSPMQPNQIWVGALPEMTDSDTMYFIEDSSTEYYGEFSLMAPGGITINIPHGLEVIPAWVNVTPAIISSIGPFCIDKDETNIILTYASAPSGTLKYNIAYKS